MAAVSIPYRDAGTYRGPQRVRALAHIVSSPRPERDDETMTATDRNGSCGSRRRAVWLECVGARSDRLLERTGWRWRCLYESERRDDLCVDFGDQHALLRRLRAQHRPAQRYRQAQLPQHVAPATAAFRTRREAAGCRPPVSTPGERTADRPRGLAADIPTASSQSGRGAISGVERSRTTRTTPATPRAGPAWPKVSDSGRPRTGSRPLRDGCFGRRPGTGSTTCRRLAIKIPA